MDSFSIEEREAGLRLDRVLCARLDLSRSEARRLLEAGAVRRNRHRARKGELVALGDRIQVELATERLDPRAQPDPSVPLVVRYEDEQLAIVDKPAGMPSHPLRPGELGCLANGVLARYPETAHVGYDERQPGLLNRLDNDTSGLVLIARTPEAFTALRAQLEAGRIHKRYLALTSTHVEPQSIDLPLAPRDQGPRVEVVANQGHASTNQGHTSTNQGRGDANQVRSQVNQGRVDANQVRAQVNQGRVDENLRVDENQGHAGRARAAHTQVLGCRELGPGRYLVELDAGRAYRHQVRVHLAAIAAPIVGDTLYGGEPGARHHLHASRIELEHPFTGQRIVVESPLPPDWPLTP